jgi:preprotein translocase subunit SecE
MAINTLAMVLEIISVIGAFIIILELLMRLAAPRTVVAPAGY